MRIQWIAPRLTMFIGMAGCAWVTSKFGAWVAIGCWAALMAAVCGLTALLMSRQELGKRGFVNIVAGFVLRWGYKIGRGRLIPIAVTSWSIWVLLACTLVVGLMVSGCDPGGASASV